jgi:hypothetical protein
MRFWHQMVVCLQNVNVLLAERERFTSISDQPCGIPKSWWYRLHFLMDLYTDIVLTM